MWDNLWIVFRKDCKINRLQDVVPVDNLSTRRWEGKNRGERKAREMQKILDYCGVVLYNQEDV